MVQLFEWGDQAERDRRARRSGPSWRYTGIAALRFLYRVTLQRDWNIAGAIPGPKQPKPLPAVPSPEEVLRFLACVRGLHHCTILSTCYATGLRISEVIRLRPTHPLETLRKYWRRTRPQGQWLFPGKIPGCHIPCHAVYDSSRAPSAAAVLPRLSHRTLCVICRAIARIWSQISARSSPCSAVAASPRRPATCTSRPARSTCSPARNPPTETPIRPGEPPTPRTRRCLPTLS